MQPSFLVMFLIKIQKSCFFNSCILLRRSFYSFTKYHIAIMRIKCSKVGVPISGLNLQTWELLIGWLVRSLYDLRTRIVVLIGYLFGFIYVLINLAFSLCVCVYSVKTLTTKYMFLLPLYTHLCHNHDFQFNGAQLSFGTNLRVFHWNLKGEIPELIQAVGCWFNGDFYYLLYDSPRSRNCLTVCLDALFMIESLNAK